MKDNPAKLMLISTYITVQIDTPSMLTKMKVCSHNLFMCVCVCNSARNQYVRLVGG